MPEAESRRRPECGENEGLAYLKVMCVQEEAGRFHTRTVENPDRREMGLEKKLKRLVKAEIVH